MGVFAVFYGDFDLYRSYFLIIVAYTGVRYRAREIRNKRGCSKYLKLFGNKRRRRKRKRRKMERDESTQTTEDDGRAIPLSQRMYRYVFVRDNYPTWIETSNGRYGGWWFILLSFGIFCLFWLLLGWLYWGEDRD